MLTNAESFDRDMPIKFLPIKFDKLRMSSKPPCVRATTRPSHSNFRIS